jgi:lysozyme family protein
MQPTLMEEAKDMAKAEGIALNQLINTAVAEKLAVTRTLNFFERYTRGANAEEALALLRRPNVGEPPRKGDEFPAPLNPKKAEQRAARLKRPATRNR